MERSWKVPEWRVPRRGEVVKDINGSLGFVTDCTNDLRTRKLWISNSAGLEIYTDVKATDFSVASEDDSRIFHSARLESLGFKENRIYYVKESQPLILEKIEWHNGKMIFLLRDVTKLEDNLLKTENHSILKRFDLEFPEEISAFFSDEDSALGFKVRLELIEKDASGWTNSGSPLAFSTLEIAKKEILSWVDRLKIRRIASIINAEWTPDFRTAHFYVKPDVKNGICSCYISSTSEIIGEPAYFRSALHAAFAMTLLDPIVWCNANSYTQDKLNI